MTSEGDCILKRLGSHEKVWPATFVCQVWGSSKRAFVGTAVVMVVGMSILFSSLVSAADPVNVRPEDGKMPLSVDREQSPKSEMSIERNVLPDQMKVEYYLPYPGMLPDSPFYFLKMVRDRLGLWLTFDEQKQAEKKLFYADKRISAAMFLSDGGKEDVAVTTASKAEKYLEESVMQTVKLSMEGTDVKSMLLSLEKAIAKHVEVLDTMQSVAHDKNKDVLLDMRTKTMELGNQVGQALKNSK